MDRQAFTRFFKTPHQFLNWRVFITFATLIALWPTMLAHFFFWRIEYSLHLKVQRKPFFFLVPGHLRLHNSYVDWQDRFRVSSGFITVRYPIALVFLEEFPLTIKGENLAIEFRPELRKTIGQKQIIFSKVSARIVIRPRQKEKVDIDFLDAESKTIQFHLSSQLKNSTVKAA